MRPSVECFVVLTTLALASAFDFNNGYEIVSNYDPGTTGGSSIATLLDVSKDTPIFRDFEGGVDVLTEAQDNAGAASEVRSVFSGSSVMQVEIDRPSITGVVQKFFPKLHLISRPFKQGFDPKMHLPCMRNRTLEYSVAEYAAHGHNEHGSDKMRVKAIALLSCIQASAFSNLFQAQIYQPIAEVFTHRNSDGKVYYNRTSLEQNVTSTSFFFDQGKLDGEVKSLWLPKGETPDDWAFRKSFVAAFQVLPDLGGHEVAWRDETRPEMKVKTHYVAEELDDNAADVLSNRFQFADSIVYSASQPGDVAQFAENSKMNSKDNQYARDAAHLYDDEGVLLFMEETFTHIGPLAKGRKQAEKIEDSDLDDDATIASMQNTFTQRKFELIATHLHESSVAEQPAFVHQFFGNITLADSNQAPAVMFSNLIKTDLLNMYPEDYLRMLEYRRVKLALEKYGILTVKDFLFELRNKFSEISHHELIGLASRWAQMDPDGVGPQIGQMLSDTNVKTVWNPSADADMDSRASGALGHLALASGNTMALRTMLQGSLALNDDGPFNQVAFYMQQLPGSAVSEADLEFALAQSGPAQGARGRRMMFVSGRFAGHVKSSAATTFKNSLLDALKSGSGLNGADMRATLHTLGNMGDFVPVAEFSAAMQDSEVGGLATEKVIDLWLNGASASTRDGAGELLASHLRGADTAQLEDAVAHMVFAQQANTASESLQSTGQVESLLLNKFRTMSIHGRMHTLSYFGGKKTRAAQHVHRRLASFLGFALEREAVPNLHTAPSLSTLGRLLSGRKRDIPAHLEEHLRPLSADAPLTTPPGRSLLVDDWDEDKAEYLYVDSLKQREKDVKNFKNYRHYIWGKKLGSDDYNLGVALGVFAGMNPPGENGNTCDVAGFRAYASAGAGATLFGKAFDVVKAKAWGDTTVGASVGVDIKLLGVGGWGETYAPGEAISIPLVPRDTYHLFDIPIVRIPIVGFIIKGDISISFYWRVDLVFSFSFLPPNVDVKLVPEAGLVAGVEVGLCIGPFCGGAVIDFSLGYTLYPGGRAGSFDETCKACMYIQHGMAPMRISVKGKYCIDLWFWEKCGTFKITDKVVAQAVVTDLYRGCYDFCDALGVQGSAWMVTQPELSVTNPDPSQLTVVIQVPDPDTSRATSWSACIQPWPDETGCVEAVAVAGTNERTWKATFPTHLGYRKIYTVAVSGKNFCGGGEEALFDITSSYCISPTDGQVRNLPEPPPAVYQAGFPQFITKAPGQTAERTTSIGFSWTAPGSQHGVQEYQACISIGPTSDCPSDDCWKSCLLRPKDERNAQWSDRITTPDSIAMKDQIFRPVVGSGGGSSRRLAQFPTFPIIQSPTFPIIIQPPTPFVLNPPPTPKPTRSPTTPQPTRLPTASGPSPPPTAVKPTPQVAFLPDGQKVSPSDIFQLSSGINNIGSYGSMFNDLVDPHALFYAHAFGRGGSEYIDYWRSIDDDNVFRVKVASKNVCGWSEDFRSAWGRTNECIKKGSTSTQYWNYHLPSFPGIQAGSSRSKTSVAASFISNNQAKFDEDELQWCIQKQDIDPSQPKEFADMYSHLFMEDQITVETQCLSRQKNRFTGVLPTDITFGTNLVDPFFHYTVSVKSKSECGWNIPMWNTFTTWSRATMSSDTIACEQAVIPTFDKGRLTHVQGYVSLSNGRLGASTYVYAAWEQTTLVDTYPQMSPLYNFCVVFDTNIVPNTVTMNVRCKTTKETSISLKITDVDETLLSKDTQWRYYIDASNVCGNAKEGGQQQPWSRSLTNTETPDFGDTLPLSANKPAGYDGFRAQWDMAGRYWHPDTETILNQQKYLITSAPTKKAARAPTNKPSWFPTRNPTPPTVAPSPSTDVNSPPTPKGFIDDPFANPTPLIISRAFARQQSLATTLTFACFVFILACII